jgi:hypothetical protein
MEVITQLRKIVGTRAPLGSLAQKSGKLWDFLAKKQENKRKSRDKEVIKKKNILWTCALQIQAHFPNI